MGSQSTLALGCTLRCSQSFQKSFRAAIEMAFGPQKVSEAPSSSDCALNGPWPMFARVDDQQRLALEVLVVQSFHSTSGDAAAHENAWPSTRSVPCTCSALHAISTLDLWSLSVPPTLPGAYEGFQSGCPAPDVTHKKSLARSVRDLRLRFPKSAGQHVGTVLPHVWTLELFTGIV